MDSDIMVYNNIFIQIYDALDKLLENEKIADSLKPENNSYFFRLCALYPNIELKIIKSHCLAILCIMSYHIYYN